MAAATDICRCGHAREAHEHYRAGRDCALCGPEVCRRFSPAGGIPRRLVAAVRRLLG